MAVVNVSRADDWGRDAVINIDEAGTKALTTAIGILGPRIAATAARPRGRRAGGHH